MDFDATEDWYIKRVNPNSKIPALVDKQGPGDKPLRVFESGAILVYLAKKYSTISSSLFYAS